MSGTIIGQCGFTPATCEELTEVRVDVGAAKERLAGLEHWQTAQNGHLDRIDSRLDRLIWWLLGILAASAGTLVLTVMQLTGVFHRNWEVPKVQHPTAIVLNDSAPVATIPPETPKKEKQ